MQNYPTSETLTPEQNIDNSLPYLFNFNFPIFDENYRIPLEKKITTHFYFREIAFETFGLFQFMLQRKLNEIMPYYNKLYETELLQFNPLYNRNFTEKFIGNEKDTMNQGSNSSRDTTQDINLGEDVSNKRTNNLTASDTGTLASTTDTVAGTKSNGTSNVTDSSTTSDTSTATQNTDTTLHQKHVHSDTPQGLIAMADITNNLYASDAQINDDTSTVQQTTDSTSKGSVDATSDATTTDETTSSGKVTANQDTTDTRTEDVTENVTSTRAQTTDLTRKDTETAALTRNANSTEDYIREITGFDGTSPVDLLNKFRESLLNIDMMVIGELNELFFSLWE